nr:hypothetical protein [Tanacetum cinerariifolium]
FSLLLTPLCCDVPMKLRLVFPPWRGVTLIRREMCIQRKLSEWNTSEIHLIAFNVKFSDMVLFNVLRGLMRLYLVLHLRPLLPLISLVMDLQKLKERKIKKTVTNKSGADLGTKGQVGANSSINKTNGPYTSNSFDLLNNVEVGDECGVSSSMGNLEDKKEMGHATTSKHTSSAWNEDFESDDEVDEVIFPKVLEVDQALG